MTLEKIQVYKDIKNETVQSNEEENDMKWWNGKV